MNIKRRKLGHQVSTKIESIQLTDLPNEILLMIVGFIPNRVLVGVIMTVPELFNKFCFYAYSEDAKRDLIFNPKTFQNRLIVEEQKSVSLPDFPIIITEINPGIKITYKGSNPDQRKFIVITESSFKETDHVSDHIKNSLFIIRSNIDMNENVPDFMLFSPSVKKGFMFEIELRLHFLVHCDQQDPSYVEQLDSYINEGMEYVQCLKRLNGSYIRAKFEEAQDSVDKYLDSLINSEKSDEDSR